MNATKRSVARIGLLLGSAMALALTGCQTRVVQSRTVYVPAPAPPVEYAHQPPPPAVVVAPPEQPPVVVIQSENDFYEPLGAYGRWVVVGSYGRCWVPARVEVGWRPYSNGYWQRTDAGWYWASEEPWGWATYHYGRWDLHAEFGWIWVPHTQWAPAWVAWREGGGYVGWAPLRPSVRIGVSIGTADYEPAYASRAYVFVEHRRMLEPVRSKTVIVNNTTIINNTVNITNVKIVNKTVINEGPRPELIERASGRKVQTVEAREFRHREETTVAARERNIPTNRGRTVQPAARIEPQPVKQSAVQPRNAHVNEKPAEVVAPSPRPAVPQTPARPEVRNAARGERNRETETARKINHPTVNPPPKAEVKRAEEVLPRRVVQSFEKPAVQPRNAHVNEKPAEVVAPSPRPAVPQAPARPEVRNATHEGRNSETDAAKKVIAPTNRPQPKAEHRREETVSQRHEARPIEQPVVATKPATHPTTASQRREELKSRTNPEKPATPTPPVVAVKPGAVPGAEPARQSQVAPNGKSRAAERAEANKKKQEDREQKKRSDDQEAGDSKGQPR